MGTERDILWLTLESVRADHTSLHGYHRKTTPFLEEMSERADALALDLGCAASMWTPASTASMFTGTHLSTHQVGRDGKGQEKLPASLDTLPGLLSTAGYTTALFSPNPYISAETGLDRGFDHVEVITRSRSDYVRSDSVGLDAWRCVLRCLRDRTTVRPSRLLEEVEHAENCLLARRVERWLRSSTRGSEPFFVYAHLPSPHHPYRPPSRFVDSFFEAVELDLAAVRRLSDQVYTGSDGIKRRMASGLDLPAAQLAGIQALYDGEIRYADSTVRQLVSAARSASSRPLLVVVTGDHGELFGEYGLIGHNLALHDGLVRVPMLVAGLDGIRDEPETLSAHVDLTYTLAAVTDVLTEQFEGRDLRDDDRPYAISQRGLAHLDAYTEHDPDFDTSRFFERPFTSVRTPEWKYLANDDRRRLYRLPDEETDVTEDHPEIAEKLQSVLDAEAIDWAADYDAEAVEFDAEARSRLQDLGYLA
jgi:uncharacterized sulfatase